MDQQGHCLPCCIAAILLYCILDLAILCSTQLAQTVAQEKRAGKANKLSAWQFSTQVYREPTTHHLNIYLYLYISICVHTLPHRDSPSLPWPTRVINIVDEVGFELMTVACIHQVNDCQPLLIFRVARSSEPVILGTKTNRLSVSANVGLTPKNGYFTEKIMFSTCFPIIFRQTDGLGLEEDTQRSFHHGTSKILEV